MTPSLHTDSVVLLTRFLPNWEQITPLREYAELCVKGRTKPGVASRLGIVVQELLENAIKYSIAGQEIELSIQLRDDHVVEIRIMNRAHPSRSAILTRELSRASSEPAKEAFVNALRRAQRLPEGASMSAMLGLSRIALEATLSLDIQADRVLLIARIESAGRRR